jgi:nicotinate-nucleotide adenylyltransferase
LQVANNDFKGISPRFDDAIMARRIGSPFRLGVLGGTFDPVHNGHLALAQAAMAADRLDGVLFIPAGEPYYHDKRCAASAAQRFAMLEAALRGHDRFDASRIEIDRPGPTYTVDTLRMLHDAYGWHAILSFICGKDILHELADWKDASLIAEMTLILFADRPGCEPWPHDPVRHRLADKFTVERFEMPAHDVSSTAIRAALKAGAATSGLLPEAVRRYIDENGLYV